MPSIRKTFRKELSELKRAYIWGLHKAGKSIRDIAADAQVPKSTVSDTLALIRQNQADRVDNIFKSKPRSGAPSTISERGKRHLIRHAIANRKDTLEVLSTSAKTGYTVSRHLIRKTLRFHGYNRRKARKKPFISSTNKKKRLDFIKANQYTPWSLVCWSDEVYFYTGEDKTTAYVTRTSGEEFKEECLQATFKSGREAVGFWACFMGPEKGPIVSIPRGCRLNRQEYLDLIFLPYFLPFYLKMRTKYGSGVRIQEDNASYHSGGLIDKFKTAAAVKSLVWPPQSPDLSPIENIWWEMKIQIGRRRHKIKGRAAMATAVVETWAQLSTEVLVKYVNTMPKRIGLLEKARGGPIKY